jgi:isopentenyl-diphosphate delta-isomerase
MRHEVILVNEDDKATGTMEKMEAHRKGLLHRAFSVFIFNSKKEMLLQQRATNKYHSGGLWTNTCCSHPLPGEETTKGAELRLFEEMGFNAALEEVFHFIYRHNFENGLTEFEFDHVFVGYYDGSVYPDQDEACDYCFMSMDDIESSLAAHPEEFSAWFQIAFPMMKKWFQSSGKFQTA